MPVFEKGSRVLVLEVDPYVSNEVSRTAKQAIRLSTVAFGEGFAIFSGRVV